MSDGYGIYRSHLKRLRCWIYLERKRECFVVTSKAQGVQVLSARA